MSVATQVVVLFVKGVSLGISDGAHLFPVCIKACWLCAGKEFKIHLECNDDKRHPYGSHYLDKCFVEIDGKSILLSEFCYVTGFPLPKLVDGEFDYAELQEAITARHLHLKEIEIVVPVEE